MIVNYYVIIMTNKYNKDRPKNNLKYLIHNQMSPSKIVDMIILNMSRI